MIYKCDVCKQNSSDVWTDQAIVDRLKVFFPDNPNLEVSILCQPCYKRMRLAEKDCE